MSEPLRRDSVGSDAWDMADPAPSAFVFVADDGDVTSVQGTPPVVPRDGPAPPPCDLPPAERAPDASDARIARQMNDDERRALDARARAEEADARVARELAAQDRGRPPAASDAATAGPRCECLGASSGIHRPTCPLRP